MIDVCNEHLLSFTEAVKTLPSRPSIVTIWRWRNRGVCGVKLEFVCLGGRTYTSLEALNRFFERVTAAKHGQPAPSRPIRQREAQQQAARQQLRKAGLLE